METMFRDLSVSREEASRDEEAIRSAVRELPDPLRKQYFERLDRRLRDPDTYAVLNWLLVGAHHFYLGRWFRGLLNIALITIALLLIFPGSGVIAYAGVLLFVMVAVIELLQLFRSQTIVADYNNQQARDVLAQLSVRSGNP